MQNNNVNINPFHSNLFFYTFFLFTVLTYLFRLLLPTQQLSDENNRAGSQNESVDAGYIYFLMFASLLFKRLLHNVTTGSRHDNSSLDGSDDRWTLLIFTFSGFLLKLYHRPLLWVLAANSFNIMLALPQATTDIVQWGESLFMRNHLQYTEYTVIEVTANNEEEGPSNEDRYYSGIQNRR